MVSDSVDGGYQLRIRSLEGTPNYGPRQEQTTSREQTTVLKHAPSKGHSSDHVAIEVGRTSDSNTCTLGFPPYDYKIGV
jgi:hypothetical protein